MSAGAAVRLVRETGFLLDTNAVSEWTKPRPNPGLVRWLDGVDEDRTYLSVLSFGEIRDGVERLSDGLKKRRLTKWLTADLADRFSGRVLPVDEAVAHAWGQLLAQAATEGEPLNRVDALIAATARTHGLSVVTRNGKHFRATGVPVVDPWDA